MRVEKKQRVYKERKIYQELNGYKEQMSITPREEKVWDIVQRSQEVFALCEQEGRLHYMEFVAAQLQLIRKRWWLLQLFLLGITCIILPYAKNEVYITRTLAVIGVLFVVLLIPEFWKNKSCNCMQVEAACLYSLRQIYAVRLFLFGIADVFMLTCFCMALQGKFSLGFEEVLVQFLFPSAVAACICFGTLCSNFQINEGTAMLLCLLWCGVWYAVIINEAIYEKVTFPVWCVLFGMALLFLTGAAYQTVHACNRYWEVDLGGITNS